MAVSKYSLPFKIYIIYLLFSIYGITKSDNLDDSLAYQTGLGDQPMFSAAEKPFRFLNSRPTTDYCTVYNSTKLCCNVWFSDSSSGKGKLVKI